MDFCIFSSQMFQRKARRIYFTNEQCPCCMRGPKSQKPVFEGNIVGQTTVSNCTCKTLSNFQLIIHFLFLVFIIRVEAFQHLQTLKILENCCYYRRKIVLTMSLHRFDPGPNFSFKSFKSINRYMELKKRYIKQNNVISLLEILSVQLLSHSSTRS